MGRRESTELDRFAALCREYGVTYGQGVAMGLTLPTREKGECEPAKSSLPERTDQSGPKWKAGPLDCRKLAELYNCGCSTQEIADGLGISLKTAYNRMNKLGLRSNRTQGGKKVHNPEITPRQLYKRAEAVGMPVAELWESAYRREDKYGCGSEIDRVADYRGLDGM